VPELGNPAAVLSVLTDLTEEHPLVESIAAAHLRALHALGRTAEAIDRYMRISSRLSDELGMNPGADLRQAHQLMIYQAPVATLPTRAPPRLTIEVPAQP
jgi:DNA-binding SARP family transcriptional activator